MSLRSDVNDLSARVAAEFRTNRRSHSPSLTRVDGVLTRVDYASDGSYKILTRVDGVLTQVDHVFPDRTIRKTFIRDAGGALLSITETVI